MQNALMGTDEDFGERLRKARLASGIDPGVAAKRMNIAYSTLMNHEKGYRGAKRRAAEYAELYRVNLHWLVKNAGAMKGVGAPDPFDGLTDDERRAVENLIDTFRRGRTA